MHLYIVRNHFTEVTHMTRAQGSSFIPGPRLIWTHPYTRQLTDRTENWKQYGQLIVVYRVDLDSTWTWNKWGALSFCLRKHLVTSASVAWLASSTITMSKARERPPCTPVENSDIYKED